MCGISGIVTKNNKELGSRKSLEVMTDSIRVRGPDDCGYYESRNSDERYVGLGHRRLSIIDIDAGKQPITNEDESVFLVFNGEIYNYQALRIQLQSKGHIFRTLSDSEVIVHAYEEYGDDCVKHFRGMFAFAIWDESKNRLFLARDRFGKKPLFYYLQNETILFSSEIKSITSVVKCVLNTGTISDYLVHRYVPGPETLYQNIQKLNPGSIATFQNGIFEQSRYYYPHDKFINTSNSSPSNAVNTFAEKLREAVKLRMISDVPFGAFLSGGIDSSVIVALMSECSEFAVKTFSVGFSESDYSELEYAAVIAKHFNTDHHELIVSHDELIENLPNLIRYRDAPVSEPSDIPIYLLAKEASKTVKMVLTGEGSDEILGGYPKHVFENYVNRYQWIPEIVRDYLMEPLINALPYRYRRAKTAISTMGIESASERQPRWFGAISYAEIKDLLAKGMYTGLNKSSRFPYSVENSTSALRKILYFDQTSWLPDNLLERGDRMTMAASIEARMPFMDHELSEFVSSLPDSYRVRGRQTKWILREAAANLIPRSIINRPKVGFRLPVNEWFRGHMKDYLRDNLLGNESLSKRFYRRNALVRTVNDHVSGRHNHEKLLWTMLNLELWLKQNQDYLEDVTLGVAT